MLQQRILTAIVIGAVLSLVVLFAPPMVSLGILALIALGAAWEWALFPHLRTPVTRAGYVLFLTAIVLAVWHFTQPDPRLLRMVLGASLGWWAVAFVWVVFAPATQNKATAFLGGVFVIVPAVIALAQLYRLPMGAQLVLFLLVLVWAADVGAFFAGRTFGRVKLAPRVSPNKTWEGLIGGVLVSTAVAVIGVWWFGRPPLAFICLCLGVVLISIVGDLTESMFKRYAGLKDSGSIFPGHGGVLDRFDSVFAAAPTFLLGLYWLGLA
jgi:phosphatidate cytidylyltransferase